MSTSLVKMVMLAFVSLFCANTSGLGGGRDPPESDRKIDGRASGSFGDGVAMATTREKN
jgi:hypothetical protein